MKTWYNPQMRDVSNSFRSHIKLASVADKESLTEFYSSILHEPESVSKAYVEYGFKHGRTYVLTLGSQNTVVSAIVVISNNLNERYITFMGTVAPLRNRGLMTDLLFYVMDCERRECKDVGFVAFPKSERQADWFTRRGLRFCSYVLECNLKGVAKSKIPIKPSYAAGGVFHYFRKTNLGDDFFDDDHFSDMYQLFRAKGGQLSYAGEGFLAFVPDFEEKGKYIIIDFAAKKDTILKLPSAFGRCFLPVDCLEIIYEASLPYKFVPRAMATFSLGDRFLPGMFNF